MWILCRLIVRSLKKVCGAVAFALADATAVAVAVADATAVAVAVGDAVIDYCSHYCTQILSLPLRLQSVELLLVAVVVVTARSLVLQRCYCCCCCAGCCW